MDSSHWQAIGLTGRISLKISIFGLGYVGCVSAACLAKEGHQVIGVDVNQIKVDLINQGQSPIVEKGLDKVLFEVINDNHKGSLIATTDEEKAVVDTDVSLICVGTPSRANGDLDISFLLKCAEGIGSGLKKKSGYHVVVARSTMLPGTTENELIRSIEYRSGKRAGKGFGVVMNPEFLRESTSIQDFYNPPVTVIGELDAQSGDAAEAMYHFLEAPVVRTTIKTAEMVKYACNSFHGLKVAFANEIGMLCKGMNIDSHAVMDIFCMDDKLNLSAYYLKPGFAFGGSCLPKDLRAITYRAKRLDIELPLLQSIMVSNRRHIEAFAEKVVRTGMKKIGILGLSFKAGTDDLRESPLVILTEMLIGKGMDLKIYDKNVALAKLIGANKEYIERGIPHISSLMSDDIDAVVEHGGIIIIGNNSPEFTEMLNIAENGEKTIFDLVRINHVDGENLPGYEGIAW